MSNDNFIYISICIGVLSICIYFEDYKSIIIIISAFMFGRLSNNKNDNDVDNNVTISTSTSTVILKNNFQSIFHSALSYIPFHSIIT